jgi:tripartite-type tricarboxylate transporter receptor subunit TctC
MAASPASRRQRHRLPAPFEETPRMNVRDESTPDEAPRAAHSNGEGPAPAGAAGRLAPAGTARRRVVAAGASLLAAAALPSAKAQPAAWPARPLRMLIAFPAGGATDILGRAFAAKLGEALGQPVVVENRPGAGGMIGIEAAAKSPADGYTMFLCSLTNQAIAAGLYPNPPADIVRDFVPVSLVANIPHWLVVNAAVPARSVTELSTWLKANSGKVNYASQGNGTLSHLESELLLQRLGVEMTHVAYKGSTNAHPDLLAGSVSMMFDSITASLPHVRAGRLRALAVASSRRAGIAPDVPTMQEAGLRGYEVDNWFGFYFPKGTPREIVDRLDRELAKVAASADVKDRLLQQGVDLFHEGPARLAAVTASETERWPRIVREANVKLQGS